MKKVYKIWITDWPRENGVVKVKEKDVKKTIKKLRKQNKLFLFV